MWLHLYAVERAMGPRVASSCGFSAGGSPPYLWLTYGGAVRRGGGTWRRVRSTRSQPPSAPVRNFPARVSQKAQGGKRGKLFPPRDLPLCTCLEPNSLPRSRPMVSIRP
ncbi:hypothetical protein R1flu_020027 [Riccia fluitans]|uniref:Uncharacterized protein n=1 Tax=Riccia fluitans TaxID=41844 RepID=A0ABD1ZKC0_9MARC